MSCYYSGPHLCQPLWLVTRQPPGPHFLPHLCFRLQLKGREVGRDATKSRLRAGLGPWCNWLRWSPVCSTDDLVLPPGCHGWSSREDLTVTLQLPVKCVLAGKSGVPYSGCGHVQYSTPPPLVCGSCTISVFSKDAVIRPHRSPRELVCVVRWLLRCV